MAQETKVYQASNSYKRWLNIENLRGIKMKMLSSS